MTLVAAIGAAILLYGLVLLMWPNVECPRCNGDGRLSSPINGRHSRKCPKCRGASRRPRFLLRLYGKMKHGTSLTWP